MRRLKNALDFQDFYLLCSYLFFLCTESGNYKFLVLFRLHDDIFSTILSRTASTLPAHALSICFVLFFDHPFMLPLLPRPFSTWQNEHSEWYSLEMFFTKARRFQNSHVLGLLLLNISRLYFQIYLISNQPCYIRLIRI